MNTCPLCKGPLGDRPAVSRVDDKTDICEDCGQREGLAAFFAWCERNPEKIPRNCAVEGDTDPDGLAWPSSERHEEDYLDNLPC